MYNPLLTKKLINKVDVLIEKYGKIKSISENDVNKKNETKLITHNEIENISETDPNIDEDEILSKEYLFYYAIAYHNKHDGLERISGAAKKNKDKSLTIDECFIWIYDKEIIQKLREAINTAEFFSDEKVEVELNYLYTAINDLRISLTKEEFQNNNYKKLISFIEEVFKNEYAEMDNMIKADKIDFDSLWYYLDKPGNIYEVDKFENKIYFKQEHFYYGGVKGGEEPRYLKLNGEIFTLVTGELKKDSFKYTVSEYKGLRSLDSFNIRSITNLLESDQENDVNFKNKLIDNANKLIHCHDKTLQMNLKGFQILNGNDHKTFVYKYRNERVMIDTQEYMKNNRPPYNGSSLLAKKDYNSLKDLSDKDKIIIFPFIGVYNLGVFKNWGLCHIKDVSDIDYNPKAFENLVMDGVRKKIITSLINNYKNDEKDSDLIQKKGEGMVFLLHGPPGVGKTLTAEATSELLKLPLFKINVADLGLEPEAMESNLESILKICSKWKAILLFDEADLVLESRESANIGRNAIVCLFLKYLEYHDGIIFLTTNRLECIDIAIKSRINLILKYKNLEKKERKEIWIALFNLTKYTPKNRTIEKLSEYDVNGREIRNYMKTIISLIKSKIDEDKRVNKEDTESIDLDIDKEILDNMKTCYDITEELNKNPKIHSMYL